MSDAADAIRAVYAQVRAPHWAAANLDALTDVLRDLSWLPEGPVSVQLARDAPAAVRRAVQRAVADTAPTARPVLLGRSPDSRHT